jgi:putative transposase
MNILPYILSTLGIRTAQTRFLQTLIALILTIPGRINYLNLARYSGMNEKTFRHQFQKKVNWVQINSSLVEQAIQADLIEPTLLLGVDGSYLAKSGKKTQGLASFWDSKQGKSLQGLELHGCHLIDPVSHQAFAVHVEQTPAHFTESDIAQSRVEHYALHTNLVIGSMPVETRDRIAAIVGDALYAKSSYCHEVMPWGIAIITKLRVDASLFYLNHQPSTNKVGRPKVLDGKVDFVDYSRWILVKASDDEVIYSNVVYCKALDCNARVVVVLNARVVKGQTVWHRRIFACTDVTMLPELILERYSARFALEFVYRDGKGFAGLSDCQARGRTALEFHWNASLLAVNSARFEQLSGATKPCEMVFSMEDAKRRALNAFMARRIITLLPIQESFDNCWKLLGDVLNMGVKSA